MEHLSNIDLYYVSPQRISGGTINLDKEESKHMVTVMRVPVGCTCWVTDGLGNLFETIISAINKSGVTLKVVEVKNHKKKFENINVCVPHIKKQERLAYLIEKVVEFGVNNLIIFDSANTLKRPPRIDRNENIAITAMKQSLQLYKPNISYMNFDDIMKLEGEKIVFNQRAEKSFLSYNFGKNPADPKYFFIGPEGDFTKSELEKFGDDVYYLSATRLRSETASIAATALIFAGLTALEIVSTDV